MKSSHLADKFPIVEVTWADAASTGAGWMLARELKEWMDADFTVCKTVGYLVRKDNKKVVVAASGTSNDKWSDTTEIPRSQVRRIRRLK